MSTPPTGDDPDDIEAPATPPAPGERPPDLPGTDSATSPPPAGSAPQAPAPAPSRRHREAAALGREVREVRGEVDELRRKARELGDEAAADRRAWRGTTGELAELLPRVDEIDERLAALTARVEQGAPTGRAGTGENQDDRAAPITPSAGWNDMDRETARAAWEALARFVGDVLYDQYRLSRLQIPDCWPLHPRMVREIAWLRSQYVMLQEAEAEEPSAAAGWHIRSLPSLLINSVDAVDQRECRPGIHRLTEPEVDEQLALREDAASRREPMPEPSTETGPDRPRLRPEHFPTRSTTPQRGRSSPAGPPAPTAKTLPDLIVGACSPDHWLEFYRDASSADLARRQASDEVAQTVDTQEGTSNAR